MTALCDWHELVDRYPQGLSDVVICAGGPATGPHSEVLGVRRCPGCSRDYFDPDYVPRNAGDPLRPYGGRNVFYYFCRDHWQGSAGDADDSVERRLLPPTASPPP